MFDPALPTMDLGFRKGAEDRRSVADHLPFAGRILVFPPSSGELS